MNPAASGSLQTLTVGAGFRHGVRLVATPGALRMGCMAKRKRKLTHQEKAEKKRRSREYMTIFVHGKQRRVEHPPTVMGIDVDEFIRKNADALWFHENEMWEDIQTDMEPG